MEELDPALWQWKKDCELMNKIQVATCVVGILFLIVFMIAVIMGK
jgi:hypothetical protein